MPAVVVSKTPENRSGWLLLTFATTTSVNVSLFQIAVFFADRDLGGLALNQGLIAIGLVGFAGSTLTLPLLLLTFPDGNPCTARVFRLSGPLLNRASEASIARPSRERVRCRAVVGLPRATSG